MIHELAAALGGTIIRPHPGNQSIEYIEMPSGYWLWLSTERDGKRFISMERTHHPSLRGLSRYCYDPESLDTRIGFSSKKPIATIAKDIQKRALPACESIWKNVKIQRAELDDANARAAFMIAQLNQACPAFCEPRTAGPNEWHFKGIIRLVNEGYVRVDDNEVAMKLDYIPFAYALRIAAIVNEINKGKS